MSVKGDDDRSNVAETTPLLRDDSQQPGDNGTLQRQDEESSTPAQDADVSVEDEPSTKKLAIMMGSMWIGVLLAAMDGTILVTLTAEISDSFQSFSLFSWLASSYLIANAVLQPLSGRLTDIYGRRAGILLANILFGAGTLICGLAKSEWVIILGRVIAGLGGGCINTISTFVASDLIPLRRRGLWQGFGNICFGTGSALGLVYGGWIGSTLGWRWAFLLQVPIIVLSTIVVWFTVRIPVKESDKSRIKRVDFLGSLTLVTSVLLLLLGLNSGGNTVPWNHPLVYVSLPLAGVFLLAFIYVEDRIATQPVIPVRLLLHRTVLTANLTNWFATMSYFAFLFYVPIYFQVRGLSTLASGVRLIPASFGTATGSITAGLVTKATGRYWLFCAIVQVCFVTAMGLIGVILRPNMPDWSNYVDFFFGGFGYSVMITITLLALISAVDHKYQAVITSSSYAFRSTGSTIGVTIASAVFQNILTQRLWQRLGNERHADELIRSIRDSLKTISKLPQHQHDLAFQSYMDALQGVWWIVLGLAALGCATSLMMREHTLHSNLARK